MAVMFGTVRQDSYTVQGEGQPHVVRMNPRGEIVVPDWMTQLVMDGVVYNISPLIQEAGDLVGETAPGTDNVNPSFLIDVPTATTIIPLEVSLAPEGTGTSGDWMVRMMKDSVVRYSSGGGANTIVNMRGAASGISSCSAFNGGTQIVAIANVDDDAIWAAGRDDSAGVGALGGLYWSAKTHIPPTIIGPGSWLIYLKPSNVDEEVNYSIKWAEFTSTDVT
ncbi:hypothetical protein LCGC14_0378360 [marine sediment metagenome]|uniref:Uncharacterized protein n=1 Tax=marine sediment metagenome TaxID=412755 RepID=A0A0F9WBN8_9ZZZZ